MSSFELLKGARDQNHLGTLFHSLSFSIEFWQEHSQNQQLQGTKLLFAKSELQPHVHPRTEAGECWVREQIHRSYDAFDSSVFSFVLFCFKK